MKIHNPVWRGFRYWLVWFIGFITPLMFLILDYYALQRGITVWRLVWGAVLIYAFLVIAQAYRGSAPARLPLFHSDPKLLGFQIEQVDFPSRDGLNLSGWFVKPRNGATLVVSHGIGGNRLVVSPVVRGLIQRGYGALLYDFRAHGRSQGDLCTWGWLEVNDLLGALDYLLKRPEVDASRIGALGFSMGGQVSLRVAARSGLIRAVAADGPPPVRFSDHVLSNRLTLKKVLFGPWYWLIYALRSLLTGVRQPEGLLAELPKLSPRLLLLISSGERGEQVLVRHFFAAAGEPKQLYEIPEARHTEGILARPDEYPRQLLEFFDQALSPGEAEAAQGQLGNP